MLVSSTTSIKTSSKNGDDTVGNGGAGASAGAGAVFRLNKAWKSMTKYNLRYLHLTSKVLEEQLLTKVRTGEVECRFSSNNVKKANHTPKILSVVLISKP